MTGNYLVLKGYNFSDSYAMAVSHLADAERRRRLRSAVAARHKFPT